MTDKPEPASDALKDFMTAFENFKRTTELRVSALQDHEAKRMSIATPPVITISTKETDNG